MKKPYVDGFSEVIRYLRIIKEFYDEGYRDFIGILGPNVLDYDDLVGDCYSLMFEAAEFVDFKCDADENPDEFAIEKWFFSSEDMTEYHRLAKKLCRLKGIKEKDNQYNKRAYNFSVNQLQCYCSEGIYGTVYMGTRHKYASSWNVTIYTESFYHHFEFALVMSAIFEFYSREVKVLREEYKTLTLPMVLEVAA